MLCFGRRAEARDAWLACVYRREVGDREYRNEIVARTWWWSCDRWRWRGARCFAARVVACLLGRWELALLAGGARDALQNEQVNGDDEVTYGVFVAKLMRCVKQAWKGDCTMGVSEDESRLKSTTTTTTMATDGWVLDAAECDGQQQRQTRGLKDGKCCSVECGLLRRRYGQWFW